MRLSRVILVAILFSILFAFYPVGNTSASITGVPCDNPGWRPTDFGLKDHTVFWFDGYYYIAAIYVRHDDQFAYGRSPDLCNWEELAPILTQHTPGAWDEMAIWAPSVYQEGGVYYLYYTGVTADFTQSIMLATSTNPADPATWQPHGMVFQPDHPGSAWQAGAWADCRDPAVFLIGDQYSMYYSALDEDGGIIGMATAFSPGGPWTDWGTILPANPDDIPESPTLFYHEGNYYLFYNIPGQKEAYRIGDSPAGPWSEAFPFAPGWAHEIWRGQDGLTYTSYLTDYSITISRLIWNTYYDPPHPFIGNAIYRALLPISLNR